MYIFAKNILEGRGETQNNFVYGELGGHTGNVTRYWFNTKYVKNMFSLMYRKGEDNPTHKTCILNKDV